MMSELEFKVTVATTTGVLLFGLAICAGASLAHVTGVASPAPVMRAMTTGAGIAFTGEIFRAAANYVRRRKSNIASDSGPEAGGSSDAALTEQATEELRPRFVLCARPAAKSSRGAPSASQ